MLLKQKSGETTDYGSTTSLNQIEGDSSTGSSSNPFSRWSRQCRCSQQVQLHCAAISGIIPEYGNTVGDSLIVPYLLELGAPVWSTSLVWVVTPFFDSWLQPIYGKLSDKFTAVPNACCRLGGRKPFIVLFTVLATIGLIVIPQARVIREYNIAAAVIVCILSYTLMDMSHGDMLIPTRSLLNDLCTEPSWIQYGNEKFTFYQAIGRCLGYLVVSIDWKQIIATKSPRFMALLATVHLDHQIALCFTLSVLVIWIITVFVVLSTPHQIERLHRKQRPNLSVQYPSSESKPMPPISNEMLITPSGRVVVMHPTIGITATITSMVSSEGFSRFDELREPSVSNELSCSPSSVRLSPVEESPRKRLSDDFVYNPFEPGAASSDRGAFEAVNAGNTESTEIAEKTESTKNAVDIAAPEEAPRITPGLSHQTTGSVIWTFPCHFKLLWAIQLFGWMNFAAFSLYFTSFVAIDIFNGDPDAENTDSVAFTRFVEGVRVATSILFLSAVIAAISGKFVIPFLNRKFGVKLTFFVGELVLNALLVVLIWNNNSVIMVVMVVMVYGVAIQIHYSNVFIIVERDLRTIFKTESRRAYVLSIFNLSILFANVVVSIFAGLVVHAFNNTFVSAISFFGGVGLIGDAIVYVIFFMQQRENMRDSHGTRDTMLHSVSLEH